MKERICRSPITSSQCPVVTRGQSSWLFHHRRNCNGRWSLIYTRAKQLDSHKKWSTWMSSFFVEEEWKTAMWMWLLRYLPKLNCLWRRCLNVLWNCRVAGDEMYLILKRFRVTMTCEDVSSRLVLNFNFMCKLLLNNKIY